MPFKQLSSQSKLLTLDFSKGGSEFEVKIMSMSSSRVGLAVKSSIRITHVHHKRKSRFKIQEAETNKTFFYY